MSYRITLEHINDEGWVEESTIRSGDTIAEALANCLVAHVYDPKHILSDALKELSEDKDVA